MQTGLKGLIGFEHSVLVLAGLAAPHLRIQRLEDLEGCIVCGTGLDGWDETFVRLRSMEMAGNVNSGGRTISRSYVGLDGQIVEGEDMTLSMNLPEFMGP
jgi:hypothetical protein